MLTALACLARFRERLSGLHPSAVRVVATNTFRVATNAREFLARAERTIGLPIDVISGHEEARLTYFGVAHELPRSLEPRLVIDIGGGSTELIIGRGLAGRAARIADDRLRRDDPALLPRRRDQRARRCARPETVARVEIEAVARGVRAGHRREAYASSGTAMALADILEQNAFSAWRHHAGGTRPPATADARRRPRFAGCGSNALKGERAPVLAGGLAIMNVAVAELRIERIDPVGGALRLGVLYDLLGRTFDEDAPQRSTVERFIARYGIDRERKRRVVGGARGDALPPRRRHAPDARSAKLVEWAWRGCTSSGCRSRTTASTSMAPTSCRTPTCRAAPPASRAAPHLFSPCRADVAKGSRSRDRSLTRKDAQAPPCARPCGSRVLIHHARLTAIAVPRITI